MNEIKTFQDAYLADPVVYRLHNLHTDLKEIVMELVKDKQALTNRIHELELIAPRKITVDGKTFVYRCPVELIPETTGVTTPERTADTKQKGK
jgi:hypothetical protein